VTEPVFVYGASERMIAEYASAPPTSNGTQYLTEDALGTPRVFTDLAMSVKVWHDFLTSVSRSNGV
jgi:hypothetical protein